MTAILGIDIGGTGIKGAIVNTQSGKFVEERFRVKTPHPALPQAVVKTVRKIVEHFSYKGPVGMTFPAIVKNGVVYSATNIPDQWIRKDAQALFSKKLGLPAHVVNDADAAGLAEIQFGAGRQQKGVVVMLTLGTGIGSAVFFNGKLLPNTEFGHLKIQGKIAEQLASDHARKQNKLSWEKWAKSLTVLLNEMELLLSPDLFILGGGVSKNAEKFLPFLKPKTHVRIVPAQLLNNAGIVGAAICAQEKSFL